LIRSNSWANPQMLVKDSFIPAKEVSPASSLTPDERTATRTSPPSRW